MVNPDVDGILKPKSMENNPKTHTKTTTCWKPKKC